MSNKSAVTTWWAQRVSALALVPLVIWFTFFMIKAVKLENTAPLLAAFTSPIVTMFLVLFIGVGLYHGNIGIKEIIEDYIHCEKLKKILMISVTLFSLVTAIASICALLALHLS